jgi:hypothetical protein
VYRRSNNDTASAETMLRTRRLRSALAGLALAAGAVVTPALAFHSGHTGVTEEQLKAACPAFNAGEITLFDSVSPPGNLPMTDVFEHESGARCTCTRMRTDKHSLKCGPAARKV